MIKTRTGAVPALLCLLLMTVGRSPAGNDELPSRSVTVSGTTTPVNIGSRLEPFVDTHLVETMTGDVELRMHHPTPRGVAIVFDRPWEGNMCGYVTVFQDGDLYRMYYKAWRVTLEPGKVHKKPLHVAYAESRDGIQWERPTLGVVEFGGSTKNNLIWKGKGVHGFAPFKDANPDCDADARYKAVGCLDQSKLYALKSADGIHWKLMQAEPVIAPGTFDSQNLAFWDRLRGEYRVYVRSRSKGKRAIDTATSENFIHWSKPVLLTYVDSPRQQLYTNQIMPYPGAPHIFIGFPSRYIERGWSPSMEALPGLDHRKLRSSAKKRYGMALSEGLLMTSRDGQEFHRWNEAFLRPGPQRPGSWAYGDHYQAWGIVETVSVMEGAPREWSIYSTEGYWTGETSCLRRYTIRVDGFVSAHAGWDEGEIVTRPLVFDGDRLVLNFSTSAAGAIRVELQDESGRPIDGFAVADCVEVFGDELSRGVQWGENSDVAALAGTPVRVRFVLKDADLYSFRFENGR